MPRGDAKALIIISTARLAELTTLMSEFDEFLRSGGPPPAPLLATSPAVANLTRASPHAT